MSATKSSTLTWCGVCNLHSPFNVCLGHKTCGACRAGGRTTLVVQKIHTARLALANPRVGCTERISTRSEVERGAPTRQVKRRVTPKQRCRCSHLLNLRKKKEAPTKSDQLYFLPPDRAMHPMLHGYKKKRSAPPRAKASHGVVISEAQPRLVQKLGRRIPVRL